MIQDPAIIKELKRLDSILPDLMTPEIRQFLANNFSKPRELYEAGLFYFFTLPKTLPTKAKQDITKFNFSIREQFKNFRKIVGQYKLAPAQGFRHLGAPFQLDITTKTGKTIASINIYFVPNPSIGAKRSLSLHIHFIQGSNGAEKQLALMSAELQMPWRVFVTRELKTFCEEHNIEIVGELPSHYYGKLTPKEYARQLHEYCRSYLLAGLSVEQISLEHVFASFDKNPELDAKLKTEATRVLLEEHKRIQKEQTKPKSRTVTTSQKPKLETHTRTRVK